MHALIVADGEMATRPELDAAWPGWDAALAVVIAADGGARAAARLGLRVDRWVGDGDSLDAGALAGLVDAGVPVERASVDKDASDTELAVASALDAGADRLTIIGALGGERLDHALANVSLLWWPALAAVDVRIVAATARLRPLAAPTPAGRRASVVLEGRTGDLVSLFPSGDDAHGVTTAGLRYPLDAETLLVGRTRGLSNVRTEPIATVSLASGRLLIVEAPATL